MQVILVFLLFRQGMAWHGKVGLFVHFQDLWDPTSLQIYTWKTICTKFPFKPEEHECYTQMVHAIPEQWLELLTQFIQQ